MDTPAPTEAPAPSAAVTYARRSPASSSEVPARFPNVCSGFATSVEGAQGIIATLQQAIRDVRKATGMGSQNEWICQDIPVTKEP